VAAGDTIRAVILVKVDLGVSDDTLRLRVRLGGLTGTVIHDMTAVDIVTDDTVRFDVEISVRTGGATGTAYASVGSTGVIGGTPFGSATGTALASQDWTAANVLCVTGIYDASAGDTNSATVQTFTVDQG
jgi:hypothetical protein